MSRVHLWRGQWLDERDQAARLPSLREEADEILAVPFPLASLYQAAESLKGQLEGRRRVFWELKESLELLGEGSPQAEDLLDSLAATLDPSLLKARRLRDLGREEPFIPSRVSWASPLFETWLPLGVLVLVAPRDAALTAVRAVIDGLLAGNVCVLATSDAESLFAQRFLQALCDGDPAGWLRSYTYVTAISREAGASLASLLLQADGVVTWGSDEELSSVRAQVPPSARLVEWPWRMPLAWLASERMNDPDTLLSLARHVSRRAQRGDEVPHCVYLDTARPDDLAQVATLLGSALDQVARDEVPLQPSAATWAEVTTLTELWRLECIAGEGSVIESEDRSWRILVDPEPQPRRSPLFRTLWLKPLPTEAIVGALRPYGRRLQSVYLACEPHRLPDLTSRFMRAGAVRVTPLGADTWLRPGEPCDGVPVLPRYARRVSVHCELEIPGVSLLSELGEAPEVPGPRLVESPLRALDEIPDGAKATGAAGFLVLPFSAEREEAWLAARSHAEALYAAGLDPTTDHCLLIGRDADLSTCEVALSLWGCRWTRLRGEDDDEEAMREFLGAEGKALLGAPAELLLFLDRRRRLLQARAQGLKVLWTGGFLSRGQRRRLEAESVVGFVRSAGYAKPHLGLVGYACEGCPPGTFHLRARDWRLEVLQGGKETAEDELPGRLVFTHAFRGLRVDVLDVGRRVPGACVCGRSDPRFQVLGRQDEVCRVGRHYLTHDRVSDLVCQQLGADARVNMEVLHFPSGERDQIRLHVSMPPQARPSEIREALLGRCPELREAVSERRFDLEVVAVPTGQVLDLPPVLDRRPVSLR